MKTIKYLFIFTALLTQSFFSLQAQNTEGKEFWLTFGYSESPLALPQTLFTIRIVNGSQLTTGYIYFTALGTYEPFTINPYEIFDYALTDPQKVAVYNTTMGTSNKSIYIYSTHSVSVYAGVLRSGNQDVTNVFPLTTLNKEYYQISCAPYNGSGMCDAYAVVATQNSTQVFHNKILETTLQAGEVYYRTSLSDMTGAHITSNNPVAFFAVNQNTCVIIVCKTLSARGRLFQQLAPVNTWGKTFFVPVTLHATNFVRILASRNNTHITQKGGIVQTDVPGAQTNLTNLQAGDFVVLAIHSADSGCYIQADNPIGVCAYIPFYGGNGFPSTPSQTWVPGKEQTVARSMIAPFQLYDGPTGARYFLSYALVVTPTATRENTKVSINGATPTDLYDGTWRANGDAGMSYYSMPLPDDSASYVFSNPDGIIILGYGTAPQYYADIVSYYYLSSSAMRDLDAAFYANDIHFQDLKYNPTCDGLVEFRAEIEGLHQTHEERIRWFVNGTEEPGTLNQETWSKTFNPGTYDIRMWVRYENDDTISKTGALIIKTCNQSAAFFANNVLHSELKDTTFCNKNVNFRAEIEGLHPTASDSIMWYIDNVFETSQATWNKTFENGTYEIKLVVHYDNDTYATLTGTLKIQALWIKIRNVRY